MVWGFIPIFASYGLLKNAQRIDNKKAMNAIGALACGGFGLGVTWVFDALFALKTAHDDKDYTHDETAWLMQPEVKAAIAVGTASIAALIYHREKDNTLPVSTKQKEIVDNLHVVVFIVILH